MRYLTAALLLFATAAGAHAPADVACRSGRVVWTSRPGEVIVCGEGDTYAVVRWDGLQVHVEGRTYTGAPATLSGTADAVFATLGTRLLGWQYAPTVLEAHWSAEGLVVHDGSRARLPDSYWSWVTGRVTPGVVSTGKLHHLLIGDLDAALQPWTEIVIRVRGVGERPELLVRPLDPLAEVESRAFTHEPQRVAGAIDTPTEVPSHPTPPAQPEPPPLSADDKCAECGPAVWHPIARGAETPVPLEVCEIRLLADEVRVGRRVVLRGPAVNGALSYHWTVPGAQAPHLTRCAVAPRWTTAGIRTVSVEVCTQTGCQTYTRTVEVTP